jgi:hypothetical protein
MFGHAKGFKCRTQTIPFFDVISYASSNPKKTVTQKYISKEGETPERLCNSAIISISNQQKSQAKTS